MPTKKEWSEWKTLEEVKLNTPNGLPMTIAISEAVVNKFRTIRIKKAYQFVAFDLVMLDDVISSLQLLKSKVPTLSSTDVK